MKGIAQPAVPASTWDREAVPDWGPTLFVGSVWALLFGAALLFAWNYSIDVPWWDDWYVWVPLLTGETKLSLAWLWAPYEEHRAPFQKLVWMALLTAAGGDSRVGVYYDVLLLAGLALIMLRLARDLRGRTAYADAFFPLVLMHCGQSYAYAVGWGMSNTLPATLVGLLLVLLLRCGTRLTRADVIQAGAIYVVLPLCGPQGLTYVPPLALWLGYAGWKLWREGTPQDRVNVQILGGFVALALTFTVLYFLQYQKSSHSPSQGPEIAAFFALDFAGLAFGISSGTFRLPYRQAHDYLELEFSVLGLFLLVLSLVNTGLLAWLVRHDAARRGQALAVLLVMGGGAMLIVGFGVARSGIHQTLHHEGQAPIHLTAYGVLVVPVACCLYFPWLLCWRPVLSPFVCTGLFTLAAAVFAVNCQEGVQIGKKRAAALGEFAKQLRDGEPPYVLLATYLRGEAAAAPGPDELAVKLRQLKAAGVRPYRDIPADPTFAVVPVPLPPIQTSGAVWEENAAEGGFPSHLDFALAEPQFVAGLRLSFVLTHPPVASSAGNLVLSWRNSQEGEFPEAGRFMQPGVPLGKKMTVTVWLAETIDQIRIYPDTETYRLEILEFVVLVPEPAAHP